MMKKNRKVVRYSKRYSKKARARRFILNLLMILLGLAVAISLWLIITGYVVGKKPESEQNSSLPSSSTTESVPNSSNTISEIDSSDSEPSEPQPIPSTLSGGIRMPSEAVFSEAKRAEFLQNAKQDGFTFIIFEVKNTKGTILYNTEVELAAKSGALSAGAFDLSALITDIHKNGLQAIALMNALQDSTAAHTDYGTSYTYGNTGITWFDNSPDKGGKPWINPYLENSQNYLASIVSELANAGCDQILVDKMVYPTMYTSKLNQGNYQISRQEMLSQLCRKMTDAGRGCPVLFSFDAQSYFGKDTKQYDGSPGGIEADRIAVYIDLSAFSKVDALKEAGTDQLTAKNVKIILDEVRVQNPNAEITPIFAAKELPAEVSSLLEEQQITLYLLS